MHKDNSDSYICLFHRSVENFFIFFLLVFELVYRIAEGLRLEGSTALLKLICFMEMLLLKF